MQSDKATSLKSRLILYHKGKILLLKQLKPKGGNYTLVGGNVEQGEFSKQAIIREAFEEAGIILQPEDLALAHVLHKFKGRQHRIILYFKAQRWQGKLATREPHKFKKVKWFALEELPGNLTETVRHVMDAYRKGLMYSEMSD